MKIVWMTWKDKKHPLAGGAETVNEEFAKRLAAEGHEVRLVVGGFLGGSAEEKIDGYTVVRLGGRFSVYWKAFRYYRKNLRGWADLVIDEVNTMPFFATWYVKEPNILFVHMLCREIWFYQMPFPLSLIGYLLEPLYLRLLKDRKVITVSASTKKDLMRHGFSAENIHIISEGIEMEPVRNPHKIVKASSPTLLSLGSIRPMKRTLDQIKAFELAKAEIPNLKLLVAGDASGPYGKKVLKAISASEYSKDIRYLGRVTSQQKVEILQKSHLILVTSVKEGWGLIVTEAASQGTPAVVYNVDGLRGSVQDGVTGIVRKTSPESLAEGIVTMLSDQKNYRAIQAKAWENSKEVNFEKAYTIFKEIIQV